MNWQALIAKATERLHSAQVNDPETSAEYLALSVLGLWRRSELRPVLKNEVDAIPRQRYEALVDRRLNHEPLQYIVGETEFYGIRLRVNPSVLIPRPETEHVVEAVLGIARSLTTSIRILDIGTGSGAIAIAIAKEVNDAHVTAIDVSDAAIELAKKNASRNGVQVEFKTMNALTDALTQLGSFDIIVSNPPYISTSEFELLEREVREYEPVVALTDYGDGLIFYRMIADRAAETLCEDGAVVLELSFDAADKVRAIFENVGFGRIETMKDLSGIERVLVARDRRP